MDPIAVFTATPGLITDNDPFGFEYNPASLPIRECSNIEVTNNGKIRRRGGLLKWVDTSLGGAHSAFATSSKLVFVEGDALSLMDISGGVTRLRNVTPDAQMSFIDDMYGRIFYANGFESGYIQNDVASNWAVPATRVGPRATKQYGAPPVGYMLGRMGGRTMVAYENFIFLSEPFNPFSFNRDELVIPVDSRVRMIKEVANGVWVSSSTAIYFFNSRDPRTLDPIKVHPRPAVQGTDVYLPADRVVEELLGLGVMVTAEDAILFLTEDGRIVNMTDRTIDIPAGATGTAIIVNGQYITKINTFD